MTTPPDVAGAAPTDSGDLTAPAATWFRDLQSTPPERLRLSDHDRERVLAFLDWLETERGNSPATRNQRLAVIKSFARYTAIERPEFLDQATQILAIKQK